MYINAVWYIRRVHSYVRVEYSAGICFGVCSSSLSTERSTHATNLYFHFVATRRLVANPDKPCMYMRVTWIMVGV